MNAVILAGGQSSRMGFDKAFAEIGGRPILKIQLALLRKLFDRVIIVTNTPQRYKFKGVKVIGDTFVKCGPLAGIHSALCASDSFYNFVVACDMPFLNPGLIKYMVSKAPGFDAVVPRLKNGYEALFAIYSKDCKSVIYQSIISSELKVSKIFKKIRLNQVSEAQVRRFGDPRTMFANINSAEDLCRISILPGK